MPRVKRDLKQHTRKLIFHALRANAFNLLGRGVQGDTIEASGTVDSAVWKETGFPGSGPVRVHQTFTLVDGELHAKSWFAKMAANTEVVLIQRDGAVDA